MSNFNFIYINSGAIITRYNGTEAAVNIPPQTEKGIKIIAIGKNAFRCNMMVSEINLPDTIEEIGEYAFSWCTSLKKINFGKGLKKIGAFVLQKTEVTEVTLPKSIKNIHKNAFEDAEHLQNIFVDKENSVFYSEDGVLFNDSINALVKYPEGKENSSYKIPNVNFILDGAFKNSKIKNIKFAKTIQSIGNQCFMDSKLEELILPPEIVTIGKEAFANCENLNYLVLPDSLEEIGKKAFEYCVNITDIHIGEALETIPSGCFRKCFKLKNVELGFVKEIQSKSFDDCFRLETINLERVEHIGSSAFTKCESLKEVNLTSIKELKAYTFTRCYNLEKIVLPSNMYMLPAKAFSSAFAIKEINLNKILLFEKGAVPEDIIQEHSKEISKDAYFRTK